MAERAVHAIVTGLVQGVGFRYFIYRKAVAAGLTGFVRNVYSGEVEIYACGTPANLESLIAEARIGPRSAMVREVKIRWIEKPEYFSTFELR